MTPVVSEVGGIGIEPKYILYEGDKVYSFSGPFMVTVDCIGSRNSHRNNNTELDNANGQDDCYLLHA